MAQATVLSVTGNAVVVAADGTTRPLQVGDVIQRGETIRTEAGARVELLMEDGQVLAMGPSQSLRVDQAMTLTDDTPTVAEAAAQPGSVDEIIQILEQGGDLLEELDAAAAGAGAGGGEGEGGGIVQLVRIAEGVDPLAYQFSTSQQAPIDNILSSGAQEGEAPPPVEPPPPPPPPPPVVSNVNLTFILLGEDGQPMLAGEDVVEGTRIGVLATVDNAPQGTPLVLTLNLQDVQGNPLTITIPVGGSSGFVEVATRPDDEYLQGEDTLEVSIVDAQGGNFEALDTDATTSVVVSDTIDTTKVTLSADPVKEGEAITITATVGSAPQGDLVLTLNNNQTITILSGQLSGSVTFANPNQEDVYKDGETLSFSITGATGGNFEALDTDATTSVVVSDTIDTTTITLGSVTTLEGTSGATISATISSAPKGTLVLTLSNIDQAP